MTLPPWALMLRWVASRMRTMRNPASPLTRRELAEAPFIEIARHLQHGAFQATEVAEEVEAAVAEAEDSDSNG